jgi:hypothetical protein
MTWCDQWRRWYVIAGFVMQPHRETKNLQCAVDAVLCLTAPQSVREHIGSRSTKSTASPNRSSIQHSSTIKHQFDHEWRNDKLNWSVVIAEHLLVGLQRSSGSDSMEAMAIAILGIQRKPLKRTIITSLTMKWKATM